MWNLGFKIKDNSDAEITLLSLDGTTGKSLEMLLDDYPRGSHIILPRQLPVPDTKDPALTGSFEK